MAKISELNTLTAPITSSDLVMIIRPGPGGIGYQSFKSPIKNFGNLTASIISASSVTANNFYGTATSASYALTASFALNGSGSSSISSSYALTASFVTTAETANSLTLANSYNITNLTASRISASKLANGFGPNPSGDYSHAEGYATIASGIAAHSDGGSTLSSGDYSHTEGVATTASIFASHAEGHYSIASGQNSHAEGSGSWTGILFGVPASTGVSSHAEGLFTRTSGVGAHSEGNRTLASGIASHAEGSLTTASGDYSHAEGIQTNATGQGANSKGGGTLSSGAGAHAEGNNATASANYSHAEGHLTVAATQLSHAEGSGSWAGYSIFTGLPGGDGNASHAEGLFTRTSGVGAHSEGSGSIASGVASHAEGENTLASGKASHAEGLSTTASANYQHVSGKFNLSSSNDNQLFIIGNGTSVSARSNILMASTSSLNIDGDINVTGSTANLSPDINISGSGLFGGGRAVAKINAALSSHHNDTSGAPGIENRVDIGTNNTIAYRAGITMWNSGSSGELFSGSKYAFLCGLQSKNPYGGVQQYGLVYRSKYGSTTEGTANYFSYNTASQAMWILKPSFENQSNNANASNVDWSDLVGNSEGLVLRVVTGSYNNVSPTRITSLSIGTDNGSYSSGSGFTFSAVGITGANGGLRMLTGSIYAPSSYGAKIGYLGIVSYDNQVRMGNDLDGRGYIAFASGSTGVGISSGLDGFSNNTASIALVAEDGGILLSTRFGGLFDASKRIINYGRTSVTGSITSTGYINLPRGVSSSLEITAMAELQTGSMAFNTSSMNMVVFTGNGTTAFGNTMGWKIVTLS